MPKAPKKGAARSGAAREFQRRMGVTDSPKADFSGTTATLPNDEGVEITQVATSNAAARPQAPSLSANTRLRGSGAPLAPARATGSATRTAAPLYGGPLGARARGAQAAALTAEEELSYIKGDISRLIIISLICVAILAILAVLFYTGVIV